MTDRMRLAANFRIAAAEIVADAVNYARQSIRVQVSRGATDPNAFQRSNHPGSPATRLDARMNQLIARLVRERTPDALYWSEEESPTFFCEDGMVVAWCDPLDGTTNAFTTFSNYAVVLFYEIYRGSHGDGRFEHLGGAIASGDGAIVSWQTFPSFVGEVWVDWPEKLRWPSIDEDAPSRPARPTTLDVTDIGPQSFRTPVGRDSGSHVRIWPGVPTRIAALATSTSRRQTLIGTFDFESEDPEVPREKALWLTNFGGNPLIAPLLLGELGAIIEVRPVTLHDAAYLIPLTVAGGVVVSFDDFDIPLEKHFGQPDPARRRVGPFVAAADEAGVREVLERLRA